MTVHYGIDLASGIDRTALSAHTSCGQGPVCEEHDGGRVRVACCYCWAQTRYFPTARRAWSSWFRRHEPNAAADWSTIKIIKT